MAEAKRPPLPIVLTANALLDGNVVYFDGAGWIDALHDAMVARDDEGARVLEARLADIAVVEPFLATVALDAEGRPQPAHYREKIRLTGPTFDRVHGPRVAGAGTL